jgi:hypothetical protein
MLGSKTLAS